MAGEETNRTILRVRGWVAIKRCFPDIGSCAQELMAVAAGTGDHASQRSSVSRGREILKPNP